MDTPKTTESMTARTQNWDARTTRAESVTASGRPILIRREDVAALAKAPRLDAANARVMAWRS